MFLLAYSISLALATSEDINSPSYSNGNSPLATSLFLNILKPEQKSKNKSIQCLLSYKIKKIVFFPEISWVQIFLSLTHPPSQMYIRIYIFKLYFEDMSRKIVK